MTDAPASWGSAGPGSQPGPPSKRPTIGAVGALGIVLYVVTAVLALVSLSAFASWGPDSPECDGEPMSRGDECWIIGGPGGGGTETYEEMLEEIRDNKRTQERLRYPVLIATIVCFIGATVLVVAGARRKRALARQAEQVPSG